jgi:hypothetical protein
MKKKNRLIIDKLIDSSSFELGNINKKRIGLNLVVLDKIEKTLVEDFFLITKNDTSIVINLMGFLSPRKLRTKFSVISKRSLYVFYFQYADRLHNVAYVYEFILMTKSQFSAFKKYTSLKVLEPPCIIVNMP